MNLKLSSNAFLTLLGVVFFVGGTVSAAPRNNRQRQTRGGGRRRRRLSGKGESKKGECLSGASKSKKGVMAGECIGTEGACILFKGYDLIDGCPQDEDTLASLCGTSSTCISQEEAECLCNIDTTPGIFEDLECNAFRATVQSVTVWERTGDDPDGLKQAEAKGPFASGGTEMTTRLPTLDSSTSDFRGTGTEYYDVFWSDVDGNPDPLGCYVSVEAIFANAGGHNLARVDFNLDGGSTVYADTIGSFFGTGAGFNSAKVSDAVDGDITTHTFMGSTTDQNNRLRVTVRNSAGFSPDDPDTCACDCLGYIDRCCNTDVTCTEDPITTCDV